MLQKSGPEIHDRMPTTKMRSSIINVRALRKAVGLQEPGQNKATRDLFVMKSEIIARYAGDSASQRSSARASGFAFAAISAYWDAMCNATADGFTLREPLHGIPKAPSALLHTATAFGVQAANAGRQDAAFAISAVYAAMLPAELRSRNGVFFTPPPLVERLCDLVSHAGFKWEQGRIIDPACGGGAFLAPATSRVIRELENRGYTARRIFDEIASRLRGVEIDPFSAWMAQVFVDVAALRVSTLVGEPLPNLVMTADALEATGPQFTGGFDLVIGNPPYGRVTLPENVRRRYAESLFGHANLYGVFTHLATQLVRPRGVIGFVTPTSFLGGQYFKNLRRLMVERMPPCAIDFVEDRTGVFEDVLQETCLVTYRSAGNPRKMQVNFLKPSVDDAMYTVRPGGAYTCHGSPGAPWLLPRDSRQVPLISGIARLPWRLQHYGYTVSTGPLVWNRHKDQLVDRASKHSYPLIWAECVQSAGIFEFRCERRNHLPFFKIRTGQEHLLCRMPCVLVQRTTAKEQCRRLIAAAMPSAFVEMYGCVVVENHLNMVRPVNFEGSPLEAPKVDLETIAAILNSRIVDDVFRCISGSVAVSAFELESLPLPDPEAMYAIQKTVQRGADRAQLEKQICAAYGIA